MIRSIQAFSDAIFTKAMSTIWIDLSVIVGIQTNGTFELLSQQLLQEI